MPTAPVPIIKYGPGYNELGGKIRRWVVSGFIAPDDPLNDTWSGEPSNPANFGALTQYTLPGTGDDCRIGYDVGNGGWRIYGEGLGMTTEVKARFASSGRTDPRGTYTGEGDSLGNDAIYVWAVPIEVIPGSQGTPNPQPPIPI